MAANVLSIAEQKASLSSKKKKKKVLKNILDLPDSVRVEVNLISKNDEKEICLILERLLPEARILFQNDNNGKNEEKTNENLDETHETNNMKEAKIKRKELALGVNDLNRCIKKNLISAALLASDVSPKLLIHHLNLLCIHNKIPYLHLENLRKVTYKTLGFPCIALGFKKNFETFSEVITKIQSLAVTNDNNSNDKEFKKSLAKIKLINCSEKGENVEEESNFEFNYLYRTSISERIFSPETYFQKSEPTNNDNDFISIQDNNHQDDEPHANFDVKALKALNPHKKSKLKLDKPNIKSTDDDIDYKVPNKKVKSDSNKVNNKVNLKYTTAKIVKLKFNENRKKKKIHMH